MQRYKLAGCATILLLAISSAGRGEDNAVGPVATEDPRISRLLSRLSDPDPSVRNDSTQRLINLGEAARPALRRAVVSAAPQTRAEIDRVLLHVPWIRQGDTQPVEQAFRGYADLDAEQRCGVIDNAWISEQPPAPVGALLRIILNDPCASVRWEAANVMRFSLEEDEALSKEVVDLATGAKPAPQAYLSPGQNAPLLAIAGWALREAPSRCQPLFEKSLAMELDHPSAFRGQMDFVFLWLAGRAETMRQHDRVIQLLREQANRTPWDDQTVPTAVTNLFAEQADFGPDAGFAQDVRVYQEYFTHPELVYTLSRLASRKNHSMLADLLGSVALVMNGTSLDDHFQVAEFLAMHRWGIAAEREFKFCLYLPGDLQNYVHGGTPSIVYMKLSSLADDRTDDLAAAKYLEIALNKNVNSGNLVHIDQYGRQTPWSIDAAWAEVWWHYLRAAQQAHDNTATQTYLNKLLGTDDGKKALTDAPGMAADIVPALQDLKRNDLADAIFDTAHDALLAKVTADPQDPMPKNNLAWLNACAGKNLDEAAKLAGDAVALAPDDGACLDTEAEICMRQGQSAKAVELETRAIQAKPDDVYMPRQLERFRAAAAAAVKQPH